MNTKQLCIIIAANCLATFVHASDYEKNLKATQQKIPYLSATASIITCTNCSPHLVIHPFEAGVYALVKPSHLLAEQARRFVSASVIDSSTGKLRKRSNSLMSELNKIATLIAHLNYTPDEDDEIIEV